MVRRFYVSCGLRYLLARAGCCTVCTLPRSIRSTRRSLAVMRTRHPHAQPRTQVARVELGKAKAKLAQRGSVLCSGTYPVAAHVAAVRGIHNEDGSLKGGNVTIQEIREVIT